MGTIEVRKTRNKGFGLFAKQNYRKGTKIFIFHGTKIHDERRAWKLQCTLKLSAKTWVQPRSYGRYINHSCEPNAGVLNRDNIVAMRKIFRGEEITIDYSTTEDDEKWNMLCKCGSDTCRGTIKSVQFLSRYRFFQLHTYIPRFLRQRWFEWNTEREK